MSPASNHDLEIDYDGETIRLKCSVTRCVIQAFAVKKDQKSTYEIGVRIVETVGDADRKLHHMIAEFVLKAIEEQRANWNGVPPVGPTPSGGDRPAEAEHPAPPPPKEEGGRRKEGQGTAPAHSSFAPHPSSLQEGDPTDDSPTVISRHVPRQTTAEDVFGAGLVAHRRINRVQDSAVKPIFLTSGPQR